jgi:hypothetical protein
MSPAAGLYDTTVEEFVKDCDVFVSDYRKVNSGNLSHYVMNMCLALKLLHLTMRARSKQNLSHIDQLISESKQLSMTMWTGNANVTLRYIINNIKNSKELAIA